MQTLCVTSTSFQQKTSFYSIEFYAVKDFTFVCILSTVPGTEPIGRNYARAVRVTIVDLHIWIVTYSSAFKGGFVVGGTGVITAPLPPHAVD